MGDRKVLTAGDGMMLTDGVTYGTEIYLAEDADASRFKEISVEEYEAMQKQEMEEV